MRILINTILDMTLGFFLCLAIVSPEIAHAQLKETQKQDVQFAGVNLLKNPGMENGLAGYTVTGGTIAKNTTTQILGKASLAYDASGASTLETQGVSFPQAGVGKTCSAEFDYTFAGTEGDYTAEVVINGTPSASFEAISPTTTKTLKARSKFFDCPALGDTVLIRVQAAADVPPILIDNMFLGFEKNLSFIDLKEYVSFTGEVVTAPNTDALHNNLIAIDDPSGGLSSDRYVFTNSGTFLITGEASFAASSTAFRSMNYTINDGAQVRPLSTPGNTSTGTTHALNKTITVSAGDYIKFIARQATGIGETSRINITIQQISNNIAQKAVNLETTGFFISAIQTAASNISISNSTQADSSILDATLTMTSLRGSAQQPCASGELASGTTCSNSTDRVGISFLSEGAGLYETCAYYSVTQQVGSGGSIDAIFNLAKVTDGSDTVLEYGENRSQNRKTTSTSAGFDLVTSHVSLCETDYLTTARHTYHVRREQTASGTVTENRIQSGRIYWTVKKLNQSFPTPIFTDLQNSLDNKIEHFGTDDIRICSFVSYSSEAATLGRNIGGCVASISDIGTAGFSVIFQPGTFSDNPVCSCGSHNNALTGFSCTTGTPVPGSLSVATSITSTGANSDAGVSVVCVGPK